ncbi:MAG TPA: hypothetical protein VD996_15475 [Chitinophagaceae bacterium]|nr:hypothetical protein [Chitinophagaceae bacterium]
MKKSLLIASLALLHYGLAAQSKLTLESYHYRDGGTSTVMPVIQMETNNRWHAEVRYNYDAHQTLSVYAGRTIERGREIMYSITPMLGYSAGKFNGPSVAVNAEATWNNIFLYSQTQYNLSAQARSQSFFYTWSEAGYDISERFFTGVTLQYTLASGERLIEPGIMGGLSFNNVSLTCYLFKPAAEDRYIILGLNYELSFKIKNKHR